MLAYDRRKGGLAARLCIRQNLVLAYGNIRRWGGRRHLYVIRQNGRPGVQLEAYPGWASGHSSEAGGCARVDLARLGRRGGVEAKDEDAVQAEHKTLRRQQREPRAIEQ